MNEKPVKINDYYIKIITLFYGCIDLLWISSVMSRLRERYKLFINFCIKTNEGVFYA
jgi:hypothetical protein